MRRTFVPVALVVSAFVALSACSSSSPNDSQEVLSSSTTTSTVLVAAENKEICTSLTKLEEVAASAAVPEGITPAERIELFQGLADELLPAIDEALAVAPTDLQIHLNTYRAGVVEIQALDPADPASDQVLVNMLFGVDSDVPAAQEEVKSWATVYCGIPS